MSATRKGGWPKGRKQTPAHRAAISRAKGSHTPESDAIIRQHYAAGIRTTITAKKLGMSRGAIIGRAFRLGLIHRAWLALQLDRAAA